MSGIHPRQLRTVQFKEVGVCSGALHTTDVLQEEIEIAPQAVDVVSGGMLMIET